MNHTIRKIVFILLLIIVLPVIFFSFYELNQLSENEEIVRTIYSNQIESILFSVQQYSEDLASSWSRKITYSISDNKNPDEAKENLKELLTTNRSIKEIAIIDSLVNNSLILLSRDQVTKLNNERVIKVLNENQDKVAKLRSYKKAGYNKIWNISQKEFKNSSLFIFLSETSAGKTKICLVLFDTQIFINEVLSPRLVNIVQEEFVIQIINSATGQIEYSTEQGNRSKPDLSKSLWLLPDYQIGIKLKGDTIETLIRDRTRFNVILIVLVNIFVFGGFWLAFKSIKKEVELAQIKSDFVSNVSHELRTPLALISMFAETLELNRVKSEDKKQEYYTIISKEANRLSLIVNKILNFSKIEAGKIKYHFEPADLNSIAEEIYSNYSFHLQNNGFKFVLNKTEQMPEINIDQGAVKEAVINLIDNAVKYSADKKCVELITGSRKDHVFIEVKDEGIGIADSDQKKIFEKFYRVHTGSVHNVKGTGLGLALVHHIMKAHNGKITLTSALGKGSSFKLLFPTNGKKLKGN